MKRLKLGLIGAGRIGKLHAENVVYHVPEAELLGVADVSIEAAREIATRLRIPKFTQDYQELLVDPHIDAILICTSTDTHAEIVCAAAEAQKHIFCEKPLALDLRQIEEILSAVDKTGVILQVGFHRRFDPSFQHLKRRLEQGDIGRPWLLKITSFDPVPPPLSYIRVSGGIFLDMTIHDFDMARYLMGEVEEVYAAGAALVDPEIGTAGDVDTAVVFLRFKTGALGVITNCRKAVYGHDQRIEVLGEKGGLFVENPKPHTVCLADAQGYRSASLYYFFVERYRDAYIAEMRAFVEAVQEGKRPLVTGWDGKVAVVIGYAAKKSMEERRPVLIKEIDPSLD
ncbi:MAG: inositol 2-dehydrogenase [Candidatus Bathyarchaeia archaeon]